MGSGGTAPHTLNLGTIWRKVVNLTPQISLVPTGQVDAWGSRAGVHLVEKISAPAGNRTQSTYGPNTASHATYCMTELQRHRFLVCFNSYHATVPVFLNRGSKWSADDT